MFNNNCLPFEEFPCEEIDHYFSLLADEDPISLDWSGENQMNLFEEIDLSTELLFTLEREKSYVSRSQSYNTRIITEVINVDQIIITAP
ncbi:unnamed protein product [Moneuplotes crassus]|uniref:Uncharacterized protein n=1 Tax=Euplotes crassus TaxID=5936 RepID=A0AAD1Y9L7_EUPCR|nr:unnamed protein product [Moneuplotes crassus]